MSARVWLLYPLVQSPQETESRADAGATEEGHEIMAKRAPKKTKKKNPYGVPPREYGADELKAVLAALRDYYLEKNTPPFSIREFHRYLKNEVGADLSYDDVWFICRDLKNKQRLVIWDHGEKELRDPYLRFTDKGLELVGLAVEPNALMWVQRSGI